MDDFKEFKKGERVKIVWYILKLPFVLIGKLFSYLSDKKDDFHYFIEYNTVINIEGIYVMVITFILMISIGFIATFNSYNRQEKFYTYVTTKTNYEIMDGGYEDFIIWTTDIKDTTKHYNVIMDYKTGTIQVDNIPNNKNLQPNGRIYFTDVYEYVKPKMSDSLIKVVDDYIYELDNKDEY